MKKRIANGRAMQKAAPWIAGRFTVMFIGGFTIRKSMEQQRNYIKGLADNEIQIIGIEFTIQDPNGQRQELAMFSPAGLIIPRARSWNHWNYYRPSITFHSTDGDFTMTDINGQCPW